MANLPGPQPDVQFCPACGDSLQNVPREEMRSKGYIRRDGSVANDTHTYECTSCTKRFEINQEQ